jgi:cytoskeleton protein RodZ
MTSIGEELRAERIRRGMTLQQVADETRIDLCYLEAMEEDRFDDLNLGTFFRRSFLRQYARMLGLNDTPLVEGLREQFETSGEPATPPPKRSVHIPPAILYCVLAALALTGVYRLNQSRNRINEGAMSAMRDGQHELSTSKPPAPIVGEQVSSASRQASVESNSAMIHVELRAAEPVWLSITSDGISAYQGTLETEQNRSFDASAKLTVLAGNARGLQISMNGKPVSPMGAHGQVVLLEFTPGGFRVLRPPHKGTSDSPLPETSANDSTL